MTGKAKSKRKPANKAGTSKSSAETRKLLFVEAYLSNGMNATEAALAAGYSKGGASKQGYRMSKDPEILSMIAARQKEIGQKIGLTTERTLMEVARLAYFDPRKLLNADGSLKAIHELDDDTAAAISSVEWDEIKADGVVVGMTRKVKLFDKNAALEKAMKYHGLYREDNKQKTDPLTEFLKQISGRSLPVVPDAD